MDIIEAARNGDFILAKERFDLTISSGSSSVEELLHAVDRRGRSVAHYAAEYDDVAVVEWLFRMGADLFRRDDMNKSPVEIAVLVDFKLRKKKKGEGEVLPFIRSVVLNPIKQIFYLESGETCACVPNVAVLAPLSVQDLSERFPYHNNMQALHVFSLCGKLDELRHLKERGIETHAVDDDGNSALHFAATPEVASFLIKDCELDTDIKNSSDGYTAAHAVVDRVAMGETDIAVGISILKLLKNLKADFRIQSDSEDMDVMQLALDRLGDGPLFRVCCEGILSDAEIDSLLNEAKNNADDSDFSVASHDDKVIDEDGEEDNDEDDEENNSDNTDHQDG